jgi:ketosteroid isomerase-like protein
MPEDNLKVMRRFIELFNARDIESFLGLCDSQIEFHSVFAAVGGAVYRGHDGMRRWNQDFEDTWGEEIRIEPEAFFDLGDLGLGFFVMHGRGRQSGAEVAMPYAVTWKSRDGRCTYLKAYAHREDALKDLGVSEDALEPIAPS